MVFLTCPTIHSPFEWFEKEATMRISVFVLACIAMAITVGCWAQNAGGEAKDPVGKLICIDDTGEYLARNVPDEYGKLTAALAAGKEKDIVDALFPVIEKTHARYVQSLWQERKDPALLESGPAYLYAWVAVVDMYTKLADKAEQTRVIAKWDEQLNADRDNAQLISAQIRALMIVPNQDFRTERFIGIYQQSEDIETIQAYNQYFEQLGGVKDLELLTAKQKQLDAWYEMLRQQIGMAKQMIDQREHHK
jgi:hypothetical protein